MRRSPWIAALALAVVALAGCSSGSSGSSGDGGSDSAASSAGSGAAAAAPAGDPAAPVAAPADGRQVVTTGKVAVRVDDPRAAADAVTADVEGRGGRVDERSERAAKDGDRAAASLVVRVPSEQVTATVAALRDLGDVTSVALSSDDVTGTAQDLDARIAALRTSVARLETLIADAATTADLITAEQALTDRQGALEQLVAERSRLAEQVSLSTLRVSLTTEPGRSAVERTGFSGGLAAGWHGLRAAAGALAVVAGALLPWAVVVGALVAAVVAVRRRLRRRRTTTTGAR